MAPTVAPITDDVGSQRDRILEIALRLMSEGGVHAMSMRRLADACGLNVATIYHYFPSKAELLTQVIAQRSYEQRLVTEVPVVDPGASVETRVAQLITWVWDELNEQDDMIRLLLGESLRGEHQAIASASVLSATFESSIGRWIEQLVPDLPGDHERVARMLRGVIYGFFMESLPLPPDDRLRELHARAADVAAVLTRP